MIQIFPKASMREYPKAFATLLCLQASAGHWTSVLSSDTTEYKTQDVTVRNSNLRRGTSSLGSRILQQVVPCAQGADVNANFFGLFGGQEDEGSSDEGKGGKGVSEKGAGIVAQSNEDTAVDADIFGLFGGGNDPNTGSTGKAGKGEKVNSVKEVKEGAARGRRQRRQRGRRAEASTKTKIEADLAGDTTLTADSVSKAPSPKQKQVNPAQVKADQVQGRLSEHKLKTDKTESKMNPSLESDTLCTDKFQGQVDANQVTAPVASPTTATAVASPQAPSAPTFPPRAVLVSSMTVSDSVTTASVPVNSQVTPPPVIRAEATIPAPPIASAIEAPVPVPVAVPFPVSILSPLPPVTGTAPVVIPTQNSIFQPVPVSPANIVISARPVTVPMLNFAPFAQTIPVATSPATPIIVPAQNFAPFVQPLSGSAPVLVPTLMFAPFTPTVPVTPPKNEGTMPVVTPTQIFAPFVQALPVIPKATDTPVFVPTLNFAPFVQPLDSSLSPIRDLSTTPSSEPKVVENVVVNTDQNSIPAVAGVVTSSPAQNPNTACNDAFVYCPGRSTCLKSGLGWTIDLRTDVELMILADCEIWMGVQGCDTSAGKKVGTATVSRDVFHYCLDVGVYESNSFHLYAGKCPVNDAGAQSQNGGFCKQELMESHSGDFSTFTYIYEGGPAFDTMSFDASSVINHDYWPYFAGFPLGNLGSEYVVAHVKACPVGVLESDPLFVQQASFPPVDAPTSEPTLAPSSLPSSLPSLAPTSTPSSLTTLLPSSFPTSMPTARPSSTPTSSPTKIPTSTPSEYPTLGPTNKPTSSPTSRPTVLPTSKPTAEPSASPTSVPTAGPTVGPTTKPSEWPTKAPTVMPTDRPSPEPTSLPTTFPSSIPSVVRTTNSPFFDLNLTSSTQRGTGTPQISLNSETPSPIITTTDLLLGSEETSVPTQLPIIALGDIDQCEPGLVYCPGMSDCFSDVYGDEDARGWSIEYTGGTVEDCSIYVGVGPSCNMNNARQVGTFSLTASTAHFCLDRNIYESRSFHFYAGKCKMNDAGAHLRRGDECDAGDQALYGERWDTYPLKAESGPYVDTYIFDSAVATQGEFWTDQYNVFTIGGPFRRFLSGHVDVCLVSQSSVLDSSLPPVGQVSNVPSGMPAAFVATSTSTGEPSSAAMGASSTSTQESLSTNSPTPRPSFFRFFLPPWSPTSTPLNQQLTDDRDDESTTNTFMPTVSPSWSPVSQTRLPTILSPSTDLFQSDSPVSMSFKTPTVLPNGDLNQDTTSLNSVAPTAKPTFFRFFLPSVPTATPTIQAVGTGEAAQELDLGVQNGLNNQTDSTFQQEGNLVQEPTQPPTFHVDQDQIVSSPTSDPIPDVQYPSFQQQGSLQSQPTAQPTIQVYQLGPISSPQMFLGNSSSVVVIPTLVPSIQESAQNHTVPMLHQEESLESPPTQEPTFHIDQLGPISSSSTPTSELNIEDSAGIVLTQTTTPNILDSSNNHTDPTFQQQGIDANQPTQQPTYHVYHLGPTPLNIPIPSQTPIQYSGHSSEPVLNSDFHESLINQTDTTFQQEGNQVTQPTLQPTCIFHEISPMSLNNPSPSPTQEINLRASSGTTVEPIPNNTEPIPNFQDSSNNQTDTIFKQEGSVESQPTQPGTFYVYSLSPISVNNPSPSPSQGMYFGNGNVLMQSPNTTDRIPNFQGNSNNQTDPEPIPNFQDSNQTDTIFKQEGSVESQPTQPGTFYVYSLSPISVNNPSPSPSQGMYFGNGNVLMQSPNTTDRIPNFQGNSNNQTDPIYQQEGNIQSLPPQPTIDVFQLGPISVSNPSPSPTREMNLGGDSSGTIAMPIADTTDSVEETDKACEAAWVYCPGRSKCLNDPNFNDGLQSALAEDGSQNAWGWSIEYDPTVDGYVNDCVIYTGGNGCDISTAQQVGTFTLRQDFAHFCLDPNGYTSNIFSLYAGTCRGNDAGSSLMSGTCDPVKIANNAAIPQKFPIYETNGPMIVNFTVESSDSINAAYWPASHSLFPMTQITYISAFTCVVRKDASLV